MDFGPFSFENGERKQTLNVESGAGVRPKFIGLSAFCIGSQVQCSGNKSPSIFSSQAVISDVRTFLSRLNYSFIPPEKSSALLHGEIKWEKLHIEQLSYICQHANNINP